MHAGMQAYNNYSMQVETVFKAVNSAALQPCKSVAWQQIMHMHAECKGAHA